MYMYMNEHLCIMCVESTGQCLSSSITMYLIFWNRISHWMWRSLFNWGSRSVSSRNLLIPTSPVLGLQIHTKEGGFCYMYGGNPKSGSHTCVINISSTEPASQPLHIFLLKINFYVIYSDHDFLSCNSSQIFPTSLHNQLHAFILSFLRKQNGKEKIRNNQSGIF